MHRARLQKIDQDYLDPDTKDDRVYPRIKFEVTDSGRYAYADPPVHSWPKEIRHLVEAPPGSKIISADYRAIEYRVYALLTKDQKLLDIFTRNAEDPTDKRWDIHSATAADLFGLTLGEFLALPPERRDAFRLVSKTFSFGVILYRGAPHTAQTKVTCPCPKCSEGEDISLRLTSAQKRSQAERWLSKHPETMVWRNAVDYELSRTHRLRNSFGRVRRFDGPANDALRREGSNWKVQSDAREVIRKAEIALHNEGCPLILQHHDALVAEVPDPQVEGWVERMRAIMERPVPELGGYVFPVEVSVGQSWGTLEEVAQ
jgi:DNA polymerase I-like protein with 3'-5' exonuclease and polymerase domains